MTEVEGARAKRKCSGVVTSALTPTDGINSPTTDTEPGPTITEPARLIAAAAGGLVVPGEVSPTGLQLRDGLSFAEWRALGGRLREFKNGLLWWAGDWIVYGERHYGEMYTEAIQVTGYDYGTLRNAKYVAQRIDPSRRRDNLSWSHHYKVAPLDPAEADQWLDRAGAEHWSLKSLRDKIATAKTRPLREDVAIAENTESPTTEPAIEASEIEEPNIDDPITEEPHDDRGVGEDRELGQDKYADPLLSVLVENTIAAVEHAAHELRDVDVALLAKQPDATLLFNRLHKALRGLDRFWDALNQAIGE